jgi:hypothetical protein
MGVSTEPSSSLGQGKRRMVESKESEAIQGVVGEEAHVQG